MPYKDPEKAKENARERSKRWYYKHIEEARAASRAFQSKFRIEKPDEYKKVQDARKEQRYAATRRWQKEHLEQTRERNRRRTARQAETVVTLTATEASEILKAGCLFCGSHDDLTIAHDTPVTKKGNTTRGNVFCLCRSCNAHMRSKSLKDMLKQLSIL